MESFIKKICDYYEYLMRYKKNYQEHSIKLENIVLEDLEMDAYELKWAKQVVERLVLQEEIFKNEVTITGSESESERESETESEKVFSYGEFLTKNPGATREERVRAIQKFYKRINM